MPAGHDKIEWVDEGSQQLAHRVPDQGTLEFRLGEQLVVRENQAAVIVHDGRGLDVFGPGRHTFQFVNLPILTRVLRLPAGYKGTVAAAVYFVSMRSVGQVPWGQGGAVEAADPGRGRVTLRASGTMKLRVVQPLLFVNQVISLRRVEPPRVTTFLAELLPAALRSLVEEGGVARVPQAPGDVAAGLKARAAEPMLRLGVELQEVAVSAVDAPREGAAPPGPSPWLARPKSPGEAGFGSAFGLMTPGLALERVRRGDDRPEGIHERRVVSCPSCHSEVALTARFCQQCGQQMVLINRCPACSTDLPGEARFCFHCGIRLDPA
jgi:membrane protease subunit (stomatin/prohibitin family)